MMLRTSVPCLALGILLGFPERAHAQIIRGTVTDVTTNTRVEAVTLSVHGGSGVRFYTVVASDGTFELVVPNGRVVYVKAERIGYEGVTSAALLARRGELLEIEVRLAPRAIELAPVEVVARHPLDPRLAGFLDRASRFKRAGVGRIWTRADLEARPIALISNLLNMMPVRPGYACSGTAYYVDNVRLATGDDDASPSDMDLLVMPDDLEGIEMYRDTDVPPDLLSYARRIDGSPFCMVVFAWRKPYAELLAGPRRPLWHGLAVFGVLVGIIAAEQTLW